MNMNMEVLESTDIENLIKSINMELMGQYTVTNKRIEQLTLKKKLLNEELAHRILLEAFDE